MIDLHCHILPGLDDGPADSETSLAMARRAAADGIETIVATPHVNFRYDYDLGEIERLVRETNALFSEQGVALTVLAGAELDLSRLAEISAADLPMLTLGDGPCLLVESPYSAVPGPLDESVYDLQLRGYTAVLAHPERSPVFQADRDRLRRLVERGALCSITAGSIIGDFGSTVRRAALEMLRDGLVHDVSSDAHDPDRRPPVISAAFGGGGGGLRDSSDHRRWLTVEAPRAILRGEPVPARPRYPPSGRSPWRRLFG